MKRRAESGKPRRERGVSLVLVAMGLVLLLALSGLGVDLATLYVARNEAQRAADAAALAGANTFVQSGITIGLTGAGAAQTTAATQAAQVGNANLVIGRSPGLDASNFTPSCSSSPLASNISGGCFDFSTQNDPRITVQVYEDMPTYFMKIFGISKVPVVASATAEAYNPVGQGPASSAECLKPWLFPNCDPVHSVVATDPNVGYEANNVCPQTLKQKANGEYPVYFVYPESGQAPTPLPNQPAIPSTDNGQVVLPSLYNPTATDGGGAIGEYMSIKPGSPQLAPAPSQFYPVFLPGSDITWICPSCGVADKQNSTANSAARYREFIECCSTASVVCGDTAINPASGAMIGPTIQGVNCLIHEGTNGTGQDTISFANETSPTIPYTIYSGANNPYPKDLPAGKAITNSDSVVTVPIYNGAALCPGKSCVTSVDVQGFLQLFIAKQGQSHGTVYAYVLNVSGCGGGDNESGSTTIPATTGSPIPVRLIHN